MNTERRSLAGVGAWIGKLAGIAAVLGSVGTAAVLLADGDTAPAAMGLTSQPPDDLVNGVDQSDLSARLDQMRQAVARRGGLFSFQRTVNSLTNVSLVQPGGPRFVADRIVVQDARLAGAPQMGLTQVGPFQLSVAVALPLWPRPIPLTLSAQRADLTGLSLADTGTLISLDSLSFTQGRLEIGQGDGLAISVERVEIEGVSVPEGWLAFALPDSVALTEVTLSTENDFLPASLMARRLAFAAQRKGAVQRVELATEGLALEVREMPFVRFLPAEVAFLIPDFALRPFRVAGSLRVAGSWDGLAREAVLEDLKLGLDQALAVDLTAHLAPRAEPGSPLGLAEVSVRIEDDGLGMILRDGVQGYILTQALPLIAGELKALWPSPAVATAVDQTVWALREATSVRLSLVATGAPVDWGQTIEALDPTHAEGEPLEALFTLHLRME